MELIAHRGYSAKYHDNTEEGYRMALQYKPDGIEMDVVVHEGKMYFYHPVTSKSLYGVDTDKIIKTELEMMVNSGHPPLVIDLNGLGLELLEGTKFLLLDIRQKLLAVVPEIINIILESSLSQDQLLIGARDLSRMALFNDHLDRYTILSLDRDPNSYPKFIEKGASIIRLWGEDVTAERVADIHKLGAKVLVNPGIPPTPDQKSTSGEVTDLWLKKYEEMGADMILVNDIAAAREVIPA